jgi:serine protease Do
MNKLIVNYALSLWLFSLSNTSFSREPDKTTPNKEIEAVQEEKASFSKLIKRVGASVVNISVEGGVNDKSEEEKQQQNNHPFFRKQPDSPLRAVGSGFVISSDGYIATNNHVVEKASKISVRFQNEKKEYQAKLIGSDLKTDLALLKIESQQPVNSVSSGSVSSRSVSFNSVSFGSSDSLEVGDWVIAIGNQFQLGQSVTAGIVSALSRRLPTNSPYDAFIQTDASINPGSSGGPLFNTRGEVVGINTAIFSPGRSQFGGSGFNIGIGFAIPIDIAKDVFEQLKSRGKVLRGQLGVMIQAVTEEVREALSLKEAKGALVSEVASDTSASLAGIKRRDVILAFGEKEILDHDELPLIVAKSEIGSQVNIKVIRNGSERVIVAKILQAKDAPPAKEEKKDDKDRADALGIIFSDQESLIVENVMPDSVAEKAALYKGDKILEIADREIKNQLIYKEVLANLTKGKVYLVLVKRVENSRYIAFRY